MDDLVEPQWEKVKNLSDAELYRLQRDFQAFEGHLNTIRSRIKNRIAAIQSERDKRSHRQDGPTKLSDHAILRYVERHYGIDLVKVEQEMSESISKGEDIGSNVRKVDGLYFILSECGTMCKTVLPNKYFEDETDLHAAVEKHKR